VGDAKRLVEVKCFDLEVQGEQSKVRRQEGQGILR